MSKKNRHQKAVPQTATSRSGSKKAPVIPQRFSPDQLKPSWRFRRFDAECDKWGVSTLTDNLKKVLDYLSSYEGKTWEEIKKMTHDNGKTKNHTVSRDALTRPAIKRLNKIKYDDIEEVFSLRFENLFRIIGIRDEGILDILWIDPKHEICQTSH